MVTGLLSGLLAGRKGFRETEALTKDFTPDVRRVLGISRSLPDTTMRDFVLGADIAGVRRTLVAQARAAYRSKSLDGLWAGAPVGMVSFDGKYDPAKVRLKNESDFESKLQAIRERYPFFQPKGTPTGNWQRGEVRLMSVMLVSCQAPVFLDCVPVRGETNEMGMFAEVFGALTRDWAGKGLFELVSVDAGMTSRANADLVVGSKLHYLMAVKDTQPEIQRELKRQLGEGNETGYDRHFVERARGETVHYYLWRTRDIAGWNDWEHLRQGIRIRRHVIHPGKDDTVEDRYFVSSLPWERLDATQWAQTIRLHWRIENDGHKTLDVTFEEGKHPWTRNPHGRVVVALLRRIAYNHVSLFRNVYLRAEKNRESPWKDLLQRFCDVLRFGSLADLLRDREIAALQTATA
jgi:predicted transposase YbfD/YdcC